MGLPAELFGGRGGRRGGGKSPMLWQVFSVQMANSRRFMHEGNGISTASYYKWQKKLFCLAAQTAPQFAEVCVAPAAKISATVHLGNVSVDVHSGADAETTAMVLQILQSC